MSKVLRAGELKIEVALLVLFSISWLLVLLVLTGLLSVSGKLHLDLYTLYSVAAVLGWLTGNLYVLRQSQLPKGPYRRQVLIGYLFGPLSFIYLLRSLAPGPALLAAPLVPMYGFVVYWIFFLVPVTLKATRVSPRR